ncbi:MAG: 23S rRNA (uracil(1939)-C(5))-methyltransferase RlmD, partial [Magnetococcales bacterium]|nr:23S rRNA (uracil(1939)-C(5))-methyltransferase RlmD [Magnetococcales bacterium]
MTEIELTIERLVSGGDGLGFHAGQAVFVPFSAPGDRLRVCLTRGGRQHRHGEIETLLMPGPGRIDPLCAHYGRCGGCQLQHVAEETRRQAKRTFVLEALTRLGRMRDADALIAPLLAAPGEVGYRRRASLKARWVGGRILLGFFAAGSHHLVDLSHCPILHPSLHALLDPLRCVLEELSQPDRLPQVDLVQGENGTAMILHHLVPLTAADCGRLRAFVHAQGVLQLWLQSGRKQTLSPLHAGPDPCYAVEGVALCFRPGDFFQANLEQNRHLVAQVLAWAGRGERAVDLFCGIGNFTLPLAARFTQVVGIEGYAPAVERGRVNAGHNRLSGAIFRQQDLYGEEGIELPELVGADLCLLNPPRTGAKAVVTLLARGSVPRVIYVSCDPATFARDAAHLVGHGYALRRVQPLDMLPLTHHVELVALFERQA